MRKRLRPLLINLTMLTVSTLFALGVGEIIVRLVRPQHFPIHAPGMYEIDPEIGYVLTPNFDGIIERPEFSEPFHTNSDGIRGEELRSSSEQTYRILVLGDSMAWGFGVQDHQTFAAELARQLSEYYPDAELEVLNGAVPGYGTIDQLALLQARGDEWQPDLILVQFFSINDLVENHAPTAEWATINADGMLEIKSDAVDPAESVSFLENLKQFFKQNSHLANLFFDSAGFIATKAGLLGNVDALWGEDFDEATAQLGIDLLVELADEASNIEADILFLYTTGQAQVIVPSYEPAPSRAVVANAADNANQPWIDVSAELQANPDRDLYYYAKDGHWTVAGHKAVATVIFNWFEQAEITLPQ